MTSRATVKKSLTGGGSGAQSGRINFLDYTADPRSGELFRAGVKVPLQEKPFQILMMLLRHPGELLTRKEICAALWQDSHANASLNTAIRKLRAALGETPDNPRIIGTVGSRGYRLLVQPNGTGENLGTPVRLAVTPFRNLSGPEHGYFAEWLTEQMIVQLADAQPGIKVMAPVSVRHHKSGKTLLEATRDLNPEYALGGEVVRTRQGVRVSAKLVRVRDSFTEWSDYYSHDLVDVFRAQDEISFRISCSVLTVLPRRTLTEEHPARNSSAYGKVLKGSHYAGKWDEPAFARALEFFDQAVKEDPGFARAHGALARTYAAMLYYGVDRPVVVQRKLRAAANRALELCPDLPKALVSLGCAEVFYDTNWAGAERYFRRALDVSPNFAYAYQCYTRLMVATGRHEESIVAARRARELDPISPYSITVVSSALYYARKFEQAIEPCLECIEMEPGFAMAWAFLGRSYEGLGRLEEAVKSYRTALECAPQSNIMKANLAHGLALTGHDQEARSLLQELLATRQSSYVPPYWIGLCYLGLGDKQTAVEWLRTALHERCAWRTICAIDPKLDPLRDDADFLEILKQIGFPQLASRN